MSFVHLIIIQKNSVYNLHAHYRTVQRIIEQGSDEFTRFLPGKYKDAGYIIIDHDKKTIINCQDAFKIPLRKNMEVIEL